MSHSDITLNTCTVGSGNTDRPSCGRYRNFCFTLNNYTNEEYDNLKKVAEECKWAIIGKEVGEQGTPHLQMCFVFKNAKTLSALKAINNRMHVEVMKGSFKSNHTYCTKDGNFLEFGERPKDPVEKGEDEKAKWKGILENAKKRNLEEIMEDYPKEFIGSYRVIKQLGVDFMKEPEALEDVCGEWHWGPPKTGKSQSARIGNYFDKDINIWWDGYQLEDTIVIDDLEKTHAFIGHNLKRWADKYPFKGQVKGGYINIRPKKVVVTSNYQIEEIWEDAIMVEAIKRRFKVIEHKRFIQ